MPGVPSGRACEGCRKQRKKCNEAKPACSRCIRLHLICVGSGQQRYQFKEQLGFRVSPDKGRATRLLASPKEESAVVEVPRAPNSELTLLVGSFIETIKTSTSMKYNLAWSYGCFLEDIPRRLGTNEALDASVGALISAHSSFCSHRGVSVEALAKYSRALKKLRVYLNDPARACASETLCAVMLLLICQAFIGVNERCWTGHGEGAAQILKARRYYDMQDEFECKLLLSLRGPVLFEGLFNNKIRFTPREWKTLIENKLDGVTSEGQMMLCLARLPGLMERGRKVFRGECADPELLHDTRTNYQTFKAVLKELHARLAAMQGFIANGASELAPVVQAHVHYQRSYAIGLAVGIILGCVLSAIDIEDTELTLELTSFSKEILALAEPATKYRPVGASYMVLCLLAAWVGTTDHSIRSLVERELAEFQRDFPEGQATISTADLEQIFRQLHLLDSDLISNSV